MINDEWRDSGPLGGPLCGPLVAQIISFRPNLIIYASYLFTSELIPESESTLELALCPELDYLLVVGSDTALPAKLKE